MHSVSPCSNIHSESGNSPEAVVSFINNITVLEFSSINQRNITSVIVQSVETCQQLYTVTIYSHNSPNTTMFEHSLFASALDMLKIQVELQRNTEYDAIVEVVTFEEPSRVHRITFNNNDIQDVVVKRQNEELTVSCLFAKGTSVLGCRIELVFSAGEVLSQNVSLSDSCRNSLVQDYHESCSVTEVFNLTELLSIGHGNFSIAVYSWEVDQSINRVFFRDFSLHEINFNGTSTTIDYPSEGTTVQNQSTIYTMQLQTPLVTVTAIASGTLLLGILASIIIIIMVIVLVAYKKKLMSKTKQEPQYELPMPLASSLPEPTLIQNQAYAPVRLQMTANESYSNVMSHHSNNLHTKEQTDVYEDILPPQPQLDMPSACAN